MALSLFRVLPPVAVVLHFGELKPGQEAPSVEIWAWCLMPYVQPSPLVGGGGGPAVNYQK